MNIVYRNLFENRSEAIEILTHDENEEKKNNQRLFAVTKCRAKLYRSIDHAAVSLLLFFFFA